MSNVTFADRVRTRMSGWSVRHERLLWVGLILFVVFLQWPMLKGSFYRAAKLPPPATSIEWQADLPAALQEAQTAGKLVLVDFNADWCPPCVVMKHDVWPDDAVERAVTRSYVPVLIDVDTDNVLAERYGVAGIPTVLVLDAAGKVVRRGSFLNAARMVKFLAVTGSGSPTG